jgi:hypothetical protein
MYLSSSEDLSGGTERRSAERHPCRPTAVCRATDLLDQRSIEAGVWNVSTSGACVLLEPHYRAGMRLALELRSGISPPPLSAFAEVVYSFELPSARPMWIVGLAFTRPCSVEDVVPFV